MENKDYSWIKGGVRVKIPKTQEGQKNSWFERFENELKAKGYTKDYLIIDKKFLKPDNTGLEFDDPNIHLTANSFYHIDLEPYEEQFPDKWILCNTSLTKEIVGSWLNTNKTTDLPFDYSNGNGLKYFIYPSIYNSHYINDLTEIKNKGYTEITYEQFEEHYLKTIMKKYTIEEFKTGKKAVSIEDRKQWFKINSLVEMTTAFQGNVYYANDGGWTTDSKWLIEQEYELLSFNQIDFEEHTSKKIIGYKFKEQYLAYKDQAADIGLYNRDYDIQVNYLSTGSNSIIRLKEAGVFDIWFEAVYEPEFKEGDIVYILETTLPWIDKGEVVELGGQYWKNYDLKEEKDGKNHFSCKTKKMPKGNSGFGITKFRHATSQEIAKYKKELEIKLPLLGSYSGVYRETFIRWGCTDVDISLIKGLYKLKFRSIDIDGIIVSSSELEQIIKYIEYRECCK